MCKYIMTTLMKAGKGANPTTGTCLIWSANCKKCNRAIPIDEVFRVTKLKTETAKLGSERGCAQVAEIVCMICEPMTLEERSSQMLKELNK